MFKTVPGGLLSIMSTFVLLLYFILKLKYMINREEWGLTQQDVMTSNEELTKIHQFNLFPNVTMGI